MSLPIETLPVYYADPFATDMPGSGNPAAVVILPNDSVLSDNQKAYLASYLNQPETVFACSTGAGNTEGEWLLDWYTADGIRIAPGGNSTLALSQVLFTYFAEKSASLRLRSRYPGLDSTASLLSDGRIKVNLPAVPVREIFPANRRQLMAAFGDGVYKYLSGEQDIIAVYESEEAVRAITPNFWHIEDPCAFIATARGESGGFVYRTFVASCKRGWECPGSARALMNLVPYWHSQILQAGEAMRVEQLSAREGAAVCRLVCIDNDCQVEVITKCPISLQGSIPLPDMHDACRLDARNMFRSSNWI
jgi:predicted PhzF superfamily epimerase YddE/YHI9